MRRFYDGSRPCIPAMAMQELLKRLAPKQQTSLLEKLRNLLKIQ